MKFVVLISIMVGCAAIPPILSAQGLASLPNSTGARAKAGALENLGERATVDVYLKTADGAPLKGAVVTLVTFTGRAYRQLNSEADVAHFDDLAPSEYRVNVVAPGYQFATLKVDASAKLVYELHPTSTEDVALAARLAALRPKAQQQLGRAMEALRADNTEKARRSLDSLQRLAPNHPEVNYLLGVYASKTHDQEHAKSYWERTLELDPRHMQALLSLSQSALDENDFDRALVLALSAAETDPSSWRAHAVLASTYSRKNDYAHALQHAERALALGNSQAEVVDPLLAFALASSGNKNRAVAVLKPASCELARQSIVSRSSSGLAQVSNVGGIQITCRVPARPFPTKPGTSRSGLKAETTTYKVSPDGSKTLVLSEAHLSGGGGGGFGSNPEPEWVKFYIHIPLESAERDVEARRYLEKLEKSMQPKELTEQEHQRALDRTRDLVYQHRVGHFQVECHILDGDRVMGVGVVELEVLFTGRFSDLGLPASPPV